MLLNSDWYLKYTAKPPITVTLLGGYLHLADIFLGPIQYNGLNVLKPLLNGHSIKWTQIVTFHLTFTRIIPNF